MTEGPLQVVHITDCPLTAADRERVCGVDTGATLAAVREDIETHAPPPDLIVATGDLSQDGSPSSYRRFADLLGGVGAPVYCLGGNHDAGDAMLAVLPRHGLHVERVLRTGAWFIHLLPTALAGREEGRAQAAELEALDTALRANRLGGVRRCLRALRELVDVRSDAECDSTFDETRRRAAPEVPDTVHT